MTSQKDEKNYLSSIDLDDSSSTRLGYSYPWGYNNDHYNFQRNPFFSDTEYARFAYKEAVNFEKNYRLPIVNDINNIKITEYNTKTYKRPIIIVAPPVSGKTTFLSNNIIPRLVDMDWLYLSVMKDKKYQINLKLFKNNEEYFETISSVAEDIIEDIVFNSTHDNYYIGYLQSNLLERWIKKGAIIVPVLLPEDLHISYMKLRSRHIQQFTILRKLYIDFITKNNLTPYTTIDEAVSKSLPLYNNSIYPIKFNSYDTIINKFVSKSLFETKTIKRSTKNLLITSNYLYNTIGNFIHIKIENNKPIFNLIINNDIFLSDDCRLLSKTNKFYIFQLMVYRKQLITLYTDICNNYRMPDMNILQNLGDFPCVRIDNKHPYRNRYRDKTIKRPKNLVGVFSFCSKRKYLDALIPTPDVISFINNDGMYRDIVYNHEWNTKKEIAVFRGSLNKCIDKTDQRLLSHILSLQYPDHIDSRIVGYSYHPLVFGEGKELTFYKIKGLPDLNDKKNYLSFSDQTNYKYILHIDGFVAAWRMIYLLHTKSLILKVDSKWKEYYYDELKPWVHYVPVKEDLSNLIDVIEWCKKNDDVCKHIADNAFMFATTYLTKEKVYEYMANLLYSYQSGNIDEYKKEETPMFSCISKDKFDIPKIKIQPKFDYDKVDVQITKIETMTFENIDKLS